MKVLNIERDLSIIKCIDLVFENRLIQCKTADDFETTNLNKVAEKEAILYVLSVMQNVNSILVSFYKIKKFVKFITSSMLSKNNVLYAFKGSL